MKKFIEKLWRAGLYYLGVGFFIIVGSSVPGLMDNVADSKRNFPVDGSDIEKQIAVLEKLMTTTLILGLLISSILLMGFFKDYNKTED
jgi:hypothetical protein